MPRAVAYSPILSSRHALMPSPTRIPRRSFVGWLGAVAASVGLGGRTRADAASVAESTAGTPDVQRAPTLDPQLLAALAEVVLPGELGNDGRARAARDFARIAASYRRGAELLHPYGSARISYTGESPVPKWRGQLEALQQAARAKHGRSFSALEVAARRELVVAALANERTDRMPDPMAANHVTVALVSWYFATPEATDLCYGARIAKNQCRPLVNAPKEPQKLARRGVNSSGRPGDGTAGGAP